MNISGNRYTCSSCERLHEFQNAAKLFNMWIVIRINHWAIHAMLFKGPIRYASNLHFRISIKVFIENCAVSSGLKKFFEGQSGAIN